MKVCDLSRTKVFRVFCVLMLTNIRPVSGSGVSLGSGPRTESESEVTSDSNERRNERRVSLVKPSHARFMSHLLFHLSWKISFFAKQWFSSLLTQKVRSVVVRKKDNSRTQDNSFRDKWKEINMEQDADSWRLFQSNFQFIGIQNRPTFQWLINRT